MAIVKWNSPWSMPDFFDDDFFGKSMKGVGPVNIAVDVYQDDKNVYVESPLAGVDPEKVEISVENDVVLIKGTMQKEEEVKEKDYYRKETSMGSFARSVAMPVHVLGNKASADWNDGVLKITLPKAAEAKQKSIKINVKNKKK